MCWLDMMRTDVRCAAFKHPSGKQVADTKYGMDGVKCADKIFLLTCCSLHKTAVGNQPVFNSIRSGTSALKTAIGMYAAGWHQKFHADLAEGRGVACVHKSTIYIHIPVSRNRGHYKTSRAGLWSRAHALPMICQRRARMLDVCLKEGKKFCLHVPSHWRGDEQEEIKSSCHWWSWWEHHQHHISQTSTRSSMLFHT